MEVRKLSQWILKFPVVDKLTKTTHFILVKTTNKATNVVEIYMKEVARLHGVPKAIILDRIQSSHPIFRRFVQGLWEKSKS
jgi:hypothetical protein